MTRIIVALAAALLTCGPATAQNVAKTPAAVALTGAEKVTAVQGSGCAVGVSPCQLVYITPPQIATFLAPTFEAKDADLDAIAAIVTQSYGRSLLAQPDPAAARTTIGLGSIATQAASAVAITGGSVAGITDLAIADGGTGASSAIAARSNLGLATIAATGAGSDVVTTAVAYTPTVTASSGSFTTTTLGTCSYIRIGKLVVFTIDVTLTNIGTASGSLQVTLPSAPGYPAITLVSEYRTVGRVDQGNMSGGSNILTINKLDNSSSIAAGAGFRFSGYYLEG